MNRTIILLTIGAVLLSMTIISCEEDKSDKISDPINEIAWLKASIIEIENSNNDSSKYAYYMTAKYKGETVYYYGNCNPLINYVSYVMNSKQEKLGTTFELMDKLTDKRLLWKHKDSKCSFD